MSSVQRNPVEPYQSLNQPGQRKEVGGMVTSMPVIGLHWNQDSDYEQEPDLKMLMDYWRSLLDPQLRTLPPPFLANQLEEVQVALRDALYYLKRYQS